MTLLSSAENQLNCRQPLAVSTGQAIYQTGENGAAWRVLDGIVRLDAVATGGQNNFASLAIASDIVGCETLLFGCYTFSATALTHCRLEPWPEGAEATASAALLTSLTKTQQRAAELVALRGGRAADRVLGLIRLLADGTGQVVLPTRQDIADITDLRFETISRIIKQFERSDMLRPIRINGVHATRSYALGGVSA